MFFKILFKSIKKNYLVIKLTDIMTDETPMSAQIATYGLYEFLNRRTTAVENLYNHMITMPGYREILMKHNATAHDLGEISSFIHMEGYEYYKRDYLPVALISFGPPLDYLLTNKKHLLTDKNTRRHHIDNSINLLYSKHKS